MWPRDRTMVKQSLSALFVGAGDKGNKGDRQKVMVAL